MKRLVFAVGVPALGAAALTPARADFAVIRFKDGHCQAWMVGRRRDARRVGNEAPPLQGLVVIERLLRCSWRPPAFRAAALNLFALIVGATTGRHAPQRDERTGLLHRRARSIRELPPETRSRG
jgi:hypothetical protein